MAVESGLKLLPCPFCGGEAEINQIGNMATKSRGFEVRCTAWGCSTKKRSMVIRRSLEDARTWAVERWNARAPSDAALVEALEPFARAYERWADGGNLKGWQAERMKQSVDAHRYCVAFEALAAAKGQQPALDRNTVNGDEDD